MKSNCSRAPRIQIDLSNNLKVLISLLRFDNRVYSTMLLFGFEVLLVSFFAFKNMSLANCTLNALVLRQQSLLKLHNFLLGL